MPITNFFFLPPLSFACWIQAGRGFLPWRRERDIRRRGPCRLASVLSSPLPPVIADRIRDNDSHRDPFQEGGHYADTPDEWWTRTSPRWLTIRRGCEETGSVTSDVLWRAASLAQSPLGITIAHYGGRRVELKNNPISHSSSVDIQSV